MTDLRSLHLQSFFLPLVKFGHPLSSLRHLSLNCSTHYDSENDYPSFQFLSPRYLPNLESLTLQKIYLSSPKFLQSFLTCAPQLRYLFLAPRDSPPGIGDVIWNISSIDALPSGLLSACTSLRHLGLYNLSEGLYHFNPFLEYLPPSLRTLFVEPCTFAYLQETAVSNWKGLPPNLPNLQQIIVHPGDGIFVDKIDNEEIKRWAHKAGIDLRFASEYAWNWLWNELYYSDVGWNSRISAVEIWNDLIARGELD